MRGGAKSFLILLITVGVGIAPNHQLFAQDASDADPQAETSEGASKDEGDLDQSLPQQVQVNPEVEDQDIQTRLQNILKTSQWFTDLDLTVEEGIVVLAGRTQSEDHKTWATELARRTEGVVAVVNRLEVEFKPDLTQAGHLVTESLQSLWHSFLFQLPLLVVGLVLVLLTWVVARLVHVIVRRTLSRSSLRSSLQDLFLQLFSIGVWITGITVASIVIFPGMTPSKLLAVLGLGSVAVGLAFRDIFENFFAGVLILWRFPFDKQDFIECGEIKGRVEDITIRNTFIRQVDGQLIVVPNAMLFKNPVFVLTNWKSRRETILCGVGYDENIDEARELIRAAVERCRTVDQSRDIEIFAQELADSGVNFEVTWWTGNKPFDIRESRDEVVASVKRALDEAGIEIPYPYRTLTFKHPLPLEQLAEAGSTAN